MSTDVIFTIVGNTFGIAISVVVACLAVVMVVYTIKLIHHMVYRSKQ